MQADFNDLWPRIAPFMRCDLLSLSQEMVEKYKTVAFQALTVWARQYALMLVRGNSVKASDLFYPFATFDDAVAYRTDPLFMNGISTRKVLKSIDMCRQLHQISETSSDVSKKQSTVDRRARLSRISYLLRLSEGSGEFSALASRRGSTFEAVQTQVSDGDGGDGEEILIYMKIADDDTLLENTVSWQAKQRMKMITDIMGYVYIGSREGKGGEWFCRKVSEIEILTLVLGGDTGTLSEFPYDAEGLKLYEVCRAEEMRKTFKTRADKFAYTEDVPCPDGRMPGELSELYHHEEALRSRVVPKPNSVEVLAAEDNPRLDEHSSSLPMIHLNTIETLLNYPRRIAEMVTPRECGIDFAILKSAGLITDRYGLGGNGPRVFPPPAMGTASCFTEELANDAMSRVLAMLSFAFTHNKNALRMMVLTMMKLGSLQNTTRKAVATANNFIRSSLLYWRGHDNRRFGQSNKFIDTLGVEDVLVSILSELADAKSYIALACSCRHLHKRDTLRAALPTLRTEIMIGPGFPGTIPGSLDGPPTIRTDTLVQFDTAFGYYCPNVDGPDDWHPMNFRHFFGTGGAAESDSIRVTLVYDEPGHSVVHNVRQPVIRMGSNSGNKIKGSFSIDNMRTPVKILTTSLSVNPVPRTTYDDSVHHWEDAVAKHPTAHNRNRLQEHKVMRDRNKRLQCMRVRILVQLQDRKMEAISGPFKVVCNLTKAKKKLHHEEENAEKRARQNP